MKDEKKKIEKVGLVGKYALEKNVKLISEIHDYLQKKKLQVLCDENTGPIIGETGMDRHQMLKEIDLAIVFGGDGTLLQTARALGKRKVVCLGINTGTVGFLTEISPERAIDGLKRVLNGDFVLDKRFMLRVTVYRKNRKIHTDLALNDAVINQGAKARLIKLRVEMNQRKVNTYKSDGLIIATPSGSTGHALSAGGPIVHPKIGAFLIAPICPVSLSNRPILLPDDRQLNILVETYREENEKIALTLDGQTTFPLEYGDEVKIRKSSRHFYLIRMTGQNYYKALRMKLGWGD